MKTKGTLKVIFAIAICLVSGSAVAQWSSIAKMGVGATDGCFSFSLHGRGYVGGGSNGSHFYMYDTSANTWALKGNAPGNKIRGFAYSFAANGKGYACGGDTTGAFTVCADMWMYNDTTNSWSPRSGFPGGARDAGFSFVINDTAYVGGGFDGTNVWGDFYKYNPFTDTWTALSPLPMGTVGFPAIFVISGKAYMATGLIGPSESTGLWEYDPNTDTWTSRADFPGAAREAGFGFSINNYGYVGGGMSNYDTVFKDMWRYDPVANAWTAVQNLPSRFTAWSSAFTVGNTAYVGTGSYFSGSSLIATDSFRKYRGVANTTGISEVNYKQIVTYPNPANNYLSIGGDVEPGAMIIINNLTGQTIRKLSFSTTIYVGDLPGGIYFIKCINSQSILSGKFIKE